MFTLGFKKPLWKLDHKWTVKTHHSVASKDRTTCAQTSLQSVCQSAPSIHLSVSSVKSLESPDVETGRQSFKNGAQNSKKKNHHVLAWWFVRDKVASLTSCSCYRNLNISVLATTISGWEGGAMSDQLRLASFVRKLHTLSARDTYLQTRAEWHTNKNKENKEHRLHNLSDSLLKMLQQHKQSG